MKNIDYLIRTYQPSDDNQINALAISAFKQCAHDYDDWPRFSEKIAQM